MTVQEMSLWRRFIRAYGALVAAVVAASIFAGCSSDSGVSGEPRAAVPPEASASLNSSDMIAAPCGQYASQGSTRAPKPPTGGTGALLVQAGGSGPLRMQWSAPQRDRQSDTPLWIRKVPLWAELSTDLDIAVVDDGTTTVRLAYQDPGSQRSLKNAYQRVRFGPCLKAPAKDGEAFWSGRPGAVISDKPDFCLTLAVRKGRSGQEQLIKLPMGHACN